MAQKKNRKFHKHFEERAYLDFQKQPNVHAWVELFGRTLIGTWSNMETEWILNIEHVGQKLRNVLLINFTLLMTDSFLSISSLES